MKMKIRALVVLLLLLPAVAFGQIIRLSPDADILDISTGWVRSPNSGSWFTKIDDLSSGSADDDYIYTQQNSAAGNLSFGGVRVFGVVDPPGSFASGDVVINVRAIQLVGVSTFSITATTDGFTVASTTFSPTTMWADHTLYIAGRKTREQITTYQIEISAGACQFFPSCGVAVSTAALEISNATFRSGVL